MAPTLGVRLVAPPRLREATRAAATAAGMALDPLADMAVVVAADDEVVALADRFLLEEVAHLAVVVDGSRLRVGPLVVPGRTACLRCVRTAGLDAAAPMRRSRRPTAREEADRALLALGVAWAARDLATWADGEVPSTWSRSIGIGPDLRPDLSPWLRHPWCGCSWGELVRGLSSAGLRQTGRLTSGGAS